MTDTDCRLIVSRDGRVIVRDDAGLWWGFEGRQGEAVRQLVTQLQRERDDARAAGEAFRRRWLKVREDMTAVMGGE